MATNLNAKYELLRSETPDVCLGHDVINGASLDYKVIIRPYVCICFGVACMGSSIRSYHNDLCQIFAQSLLTFHKTYCRVAMRKLLIA